MPRFVARYSPLAKESRPSSSRPWAYSDVPWIVMPSRSPIVRKRV